MQQKTSKDFFRTILTGVAGLGLEPQTIEAEAEAGKKRRGRRGRDRGRGPGRNPAHQLGDLGDRCNQF